MNVSRFLTAAAAALLAAGALAGCSSTDSASSGSSGDGEVLRIGTRVEPTSFDPAMTGTGPLLPYGQAIYDSLLTLDASGSPTASLATDFSWDDTRLHLTLTLREGVSFTDGTAFDSAAVKVNMEHFMASATPAGPQLQYVSSIDTPDADTVVLTLSEPDPGLEYALTGPAGMMGSPQAIADGTIADDPVGTGPYILDTADSTAGSEWVFTRNDDYWAGAVPWSSLHYVTLTDETARVNALKSGQIDAADFLQYQNAEDAQAAGFSMHENEASWQGLLFLDRDGTLAPELADARVREALRISIDVSAIIDTLTGGYAEETTQIFPTTADAYDAELDSAYPYDPDRAKELLAEAGYPDGFSIPFPQTATMSSDVYAAVLQYWSAIGVTGEPYQWGAGEAVPSLQSGKFALAYFQNTLWPSSWGTVTFSVTPNASYNPFHTDNDEIAALIHDMQYADADSAAAAGQAVNEYLVDNYWFGPLFRNTQFYLTSDKITMTWTDGAALPSPLAYAPAS